MTQLNTLLEQQELQEAVALTNDTLLETADMLEEALGESTIEQPSSHAGLDELQFFSQDHIPGLSDEDLATKFTPDNTAPLNMDSSQLPAAPNTNMLPVRSSLVEQLLGETRMSDVTEDDSYPLDVDNSTDIASGDNRNRDFGLGAEARPLGEGDTSDYDDEDLDDMDLDDLEVGSDDDFDDM